MSGLFVTGCGTDVGKTLVTAGLLLSAKQLGYKATVVKPVQTGCSPVLQDSGHTKYILPDLEFICKICADTAVEAEQLRQNYCYAFLPACSPHLATRITKEPEISLSKLYCDIKEIEKEYDLIIVEGAGGILVPLNENETFRDLAVMLQYETIMVSDNQLGCVNQALLTSEALDSKELPPLSIVMNNTKPTLKDEEYICEDNPRIISNYTGIPVITVIPYTSDLGRTNTKFWQQLATELEPIIRHVMAIERV